MERGAPVRAVSRSIAALQAINRHGSLSLIEIAKQIGLPYPTTCRIVQTLISEGLVECEPSRKRYRAAPLSQSLSTAFRGIGADHHITHPLLAALTSQLRWPVGLTTRAGTWMIVRDATHSISALTFHNYDPGYTFPILESACGHAWLAHASDAQRAAVLKDVAAQDADSPSLALFANSLLVENIRHAGYACHDRGQLSRSPGMTSSISVPVFEDGRVASALTLTFFAASMVMVDAVQRFAPALKEVAGVLGSAVSAAHHRVSG